MPCKIQALSELPGVTRVQHNAVGYIQKDIGAYLLAVCWLLYVYFLVTRLLIG